MSSQSQFTRTLIAIVAALATSTIAIGAPITSGENHRPDDDTVLEFTERYFRTTEIVAKEF